jgi:hypothetical protein
MTEIDRLIADLLEQYANARHAQARKTLKKKIKYLQEQQDGSQST